MGKLEDMKKEYKKLRYNLPKFEDLNKDFSIEEISEKESDFLIREIRKQIMEKAIAYLRFAETLLNPSSAPLFILALIKNLNEEDRKSLDKVYSTLVDMEISSLVLDNDYDEEKEAKFIIDLYNKWDKIKEEMGDVLVSLKKGWDVKGEKKNKGYLG